MKFPSHYISNWLGYSIWHAKRDSLWRFPIVIPFLSCHPVLWSKMCFRVIFALSVNKIDLNSSSTSMTLLIGLTSQCSKQTEMISKKTKVCKGVNQFQSTGQLWSRSTMSPEPRWLTGYAWWLWKMSGGSRALLMMAHEVLIYSHLPDKGLTWACPCWAQLGPA